SRHRAGGRRPHPALADIDALAQPTGARSLFGLSSGALIALQAALVLPPIRRVAVYEPPLSVNHSTPTGWVARYDREVTQGRLGSAAVTAIKGTQTAPLVLRFVPRFVLDVLLNLAIRLGSEGQDAGRDGRPAGRPPGRAAHPAVAAAQGGAEEQAPGRQGGQPRRCPAARARPHDALRRATGHRDRGHIAGLHSHARRSPLARRQQEPGLPQD